MSGWHLRLFRRVRIAPGVRVNISKSGPSISFGARGAHLTVGRRGVRETVGIPGTGIFATNVISSTGHAGPGAAADHVAGAQLPPARPQAGPVDYSGVLVLGTLLGLASLVLGAGLGSALVVGGCCALAGIVYAWLGHHHPTLLRWIIAAALGLASVLSVIVSIVGIGLLGAVLAGASSGRRHRR